MGSDGTVTAPDGSGRKVKLITAEDVVAYLKAHPYFLETGPSSPSHGRCRACRAPASSTCSRPSCAVCAARSTG